MGRLRVVSKRVRCRLFPDYNSGLTSHRQLMTSMFTFALPTRLGAAALLFVATAVRAPCAWSQTAGEVDAAAARKKELLVRASQARDENRQRLRSAYGAGKVTYVLHEAGQTDPLTLLDADVQFFYEEPKFHIHLAYDQRLLENVQRKTVGEAADVPRWIPSQVTEQVVIFDGNGLHSVEHRADGSCQGTIYFGFAKLGVLRSAGFPFSNPVDLSEGALKLEDVNEGQLSLIPFGRGGFMGTEIKNTYRLKFFVFDGFGYELKRVSSYRTGESQPFRDFLMTWEESNGIHYVRRYLNTVTSAHGNTGSSAQTTKKLAVEYHRFEANAAISPTVFSLASVDIPAGSVFLDRRSNVNGGPKKLTFADAQLRPLIEQATTESK